MMKRNILKTLALILCIAAAIPQIAALSLEQQARFSIPDISGYQGTRVTLPVCLDNDIEIVAFQFDLELPVGVDVVMVGDDKYSATLTSRAADHIIDSNMVSDDPPIFRVVSITLSVSPFIGNTGPLVDVALMLNANPGEYRITLSNIECNDPDITKIRPEGSECTLTILPPVDLGDYRLYSNPINGSAGLPLIMQLPMKNIDAVKAFKCDLLLPTGITLNDDYYVEQSDRVPTRYNLDYDNDLLCGTTTGSGSRATSIDAGDGSVGSVQLDIPADMLTGKYTITFANQVFTLTDGTTVEADDFGFDITINGLDAWGSGANTLYVHDVVVADLAANHIGLDSNGEYVASLIYLTDAEPYYADSDVEAASIAYKRNFVTTDWQAWYAPFAIDASEFEMAAEFVGVTDKDDTRYIEFERVNGVLMPNTPYIFKPKTEGDVTYTVTATSLMASPDVDVQITHDAYTITGIYQEKCDMADCGAYALSWGIFRQTSTNDFTLKPFRFYLSPAPSAPSRIAVRINEGTVTIDTIVVDAGSDGLLYDILGRSTIYPSNGIYINNGKKTIIR